MVNNIYEHRLTSMVFHMTQPQTGPLRTKKEPRYAKGEAVLYMSDTGELMPMLIEKIIPHAYLDGHGYQVSSIVHPHAGLMTVHENWLRPMLRTRFEMRQVMRVV